MFFWKMVWEIKTENKSHHDGTQVLSVIMVDILYSAEYYGMMEKIMFSVFKSARRTLKNEFKWILSMLKHIYFKI